MFSDCKLLDFPQQRPLILFTVQSLMLACRGGFITVMCIQRLRVWVTLLALFLFSTSSVFGAVLDDSESDFERGRADFSVQFDERVISHEIMTVSVMPGETVGVTVQSEPAALYQINARKGLFEAKGEGEWRFTAPETPGLYSFNITNVVTGASVRLQAFVLTPWSPESEALDGYRIGKYRETALRGLETYDPPRGFIKVTEENKDVRLSPNFRLGQFLCKQTDALPQYVLVRARLLQRLERILAAVNDMGHSVSTLHIMSGYRTPFYNRSIGNTTDYSRHLYGDAADIFVDADGDNVMDDLDGDGRITERDAQLLAELVEEEATPAEDYIPGGMGVYGPASHRGPFVHVDLRGYEARW